MNVFRTILSLLGVTVGIFAIIAVLTVVDSLERSIKESLSFLGSEVVYVQKWPFVPETQGVEEKGLADSGTSRDRTQPRPELELPRDRTDANAQSPQVNRNMRCVDHQPAVGVRLPAQPFGREPPREFLAPVVAPRFGEASQGRADQIGERDGENPGAR